MKKVFRVLLVALVLALIFVMPVFALGVHQVDNPASDAQMYLIGLASVGIIYVLRLVATRFPKVKLTREFVSVLVYVVALGLSLAFGGFVFPAFPAYSEPLAFVGDLFKYVSDLLIALAPPVSLATLFYNVIFKRVLDAGAVKAGLIEEPKTEPVLKAKK